MVKHYSNFLCQAIKVKLNISFMLDSNPDSKNKINLWFRTYLNLKHADFPRIFYKKKDSEKPFMSRKKVKKRSWIQSSFPSPWLTHSKSPWNLHQIPSTHFHALLNLPKLLRPKNPHLPRSTDKNDSSSRWVSSVAQQYLWPSNSQTSASPRISWRSWFRRARSCPSQPVRRRPKTAFVSSPTGCKLME